MAEMTLLIQELLLLLPMLLLGDNDFPTFVGAEISASIIRRQIRILAIRQSTSSHLRIADNQGEVLSRSSLWSDPMSLVKTAASAKVVILDFFEGEVAKLHRQYLDLTVDLGHFGDIRVLGSSSCRPLIPDDLGPIFRC
ncbi:hypothetical protein C8J56DRAFT_899885 [Mycena floridula]|nr:hypothetical protein C8J56DRAFT_899885 [Mycena floridula]